jgi:hypothetical protein
MMLSACSAESTPDSHGVLAGHLQLVGGPVNVTIPVEGSITIQGDVERTVEVGSDGAFSIAVPPDGISLPVIAPNTVAGRDSAGEVRNLS